MAVLNYPTDIRDFGATPGPGFHNTTAFNSAFAAAGAGGSVFIPPGTWYANGTIQPTAANQLLFGVSSRISIIKRPASTPGRVISAQDLDGLIFRDFQIDGSNNTGGSLWAQHCQNVEADRLGFKDAGETGFIGAQNANGNSDDGTVRDCWFDGTGSTGDANGHHATYISKGSRWKIVNNRAKNCRYGGHVFAQCTSFVCANNHLVGIGDTTGYGGVRSTGGGEGLPGLSNIINGNSITSFSVGCLIHDTVRTIISNNDINSTQEDGIRVQASTGQFANNNSVIGNNITDPGLAGGYYGVRLFLFSGGQIRDTLVAANNVTKTGGSATAAYADASAGPNLFTANFANFTMGVANSLS